MTMSLAGGASTNSRMSRPLPAGAVRGVTLAVDGVRELVEFTFEDGHTETRDLLSWVGGQAGLLWGGGPYPSPILEAIDHAERMHGAYGHAAEYELAEALGEVFESYLTDDRLAVRFFSKGGDACAAAARISRERRDNPVIATQGYHGAQTDFAHHPAWHGYPYENLMLHKRFEFGDVEAMRLAASKAACLMLEIPAWDDERAITEFLWECRSAATLYDIPLIFDDVVCGFRLALAGTAQRYGVPADMVCLGKAMSATGGISALVGREDLVGKLGTGDVFYSTTFGGAPDRAHIAAATVRWLKSNEVEVYGGVKLTGTRQPDSTWATTRDTYVGLLPAVGRDLKHGMLKLGVPVVGQVERSVLNFPTDAEWLEFCSKVIEQGVMLHRPQFVTLVHTPEDVAETLAAVKRVLVERQPA